jgi:hypothetical protein
MNAPPRGCYRACRAMRREKNLTNCKRASPQVPRAQPRARGADGQLGEAQPATRNGNCVRYVR